MKKIIIVVLALTIILGFLFWRFGPDLFEAPLTRSGPISLTYWGFWEDSLIKPVIEEYKKIKPGVDIIYVRQSSTNYRTRVQTQINEGVGPDIFRIHNTWIPMFETLLSPAPVEVFSVSDFENTFYPVAVNNFVKNNGVLSAPIEVDGLALFYNEELLNNVGVKLPKSWLEFITASSKVTVKDSSGNIQTAGAALGTAANVDHFSDILGLLILQQPGTHIESPDTPSVAEVLRFYTGFVTDPKRKSWDINLPSSTEMFASGRLAFYFAPSWRAYELRVMNPNLKFKVAPVPQLPGRNVAWASFWAEGVSAKSQHQKEAWEFVKFLTSRESERLLYATASQIRLFGEPYSRVDLANEITNDPIAGAFVNQGPYYKSWYLNSNTFDNGINDEMIKYWKDGVNAILAGTNPQVALQTVDKGVKQVLQKYGVR